VNRDTRPADELAQTISGATPTSARAVPWTAPYGVPGESEILVNATPVGLAPHVDDRLDLDMASIGPDLLVCDVIMNPPQTHLLRTAASRGATVLDGRGMLVNQAALNIRMWTGVQVDPALLRTALDRAMQDGCKEGLIAENAPTPTAV